MRPAQLYWMARFRLLPRSSRLPHPRVQSGNCRSLTPFLLPPIEQTLEDGITFLNDRQTFMAGLPDWRAPDKSKLWRYNLHYFEYLLWTWVSDQRKAALIEHWIEQNPPGSPDAWEPYPVSLRLVNWIKFLVGRDAECSPPEAWTQSLALQAGWLERNLERHLLANHYLKNAKALVFAGLFFQGRSAERWLALGIDIFSAQLREQFLADGGHYELSPMYHCLCLEDVLDVDNLARGFPDRFTDDVLGLLQDTARRALDFLDAILMPQDRIPLFNDSAFEIAPAPPALFDYAERLLGYSRLTTKRPALPDSGYFRLGDGNDRMIIDCGPVSPSYQPGHTHCDMLSYELALHGRAVVVDAGVHDYENSPERAWCRSTRAHNTLSLDGQDQSELWGVFRVARRAHPLSAELSTLGQGGMRFVGLIKGFPRLGGRIEHRREVNHDGVGLWTIRDEVAGSGRHLAESWIHLHPDLVVESEGGTLRIRNDHGVTIAWIEPGAGLRVSLESGLYCPGFGIKQTNAVVRLSVEGRLPLTLDYRIRKADVPSSD